VGLKIKIKKVVMIIGIEWSTQNRRILGSIHKTHTVEENRERKKKEKTKREILVINYGCWLTGWRREEEKKKRSEGSYSF